MALPASYLSTFGVDHMLDYPPRFFLGVAAVLASLVPGIANFDGLGRPCR